MHITFFCIGDRQTPSTRLRLLNYLPWLDKEGISNDLVVATDKSKLLRNIKRILGTARAVRSDIVFIQKLTLPSFIVDLLKLNSELIYDFDDALYIETKNQKNRSRRLNYILQKSDLVIAGNDELKRYAISYNQHVVTLPTPVPEVKQVPFKSKDSDALKTIGWIGSAHNLYNLEEKKDLFIKLMAYREDWQLHVVSNGSFSLDGFDHRVKNSNWTMETENQLIADMDIGIMPLENSEWNRGKCAYKALQMMAFAKPVVASPVGMNSAVIDSGVNGYLADKDGEWLDMLNNLLNSPDLRKTIGENAAQTVARHYSLAVLKNQFIKFLLSVL